MLRTGSSGLFTLQIERNTRSTRIETEVRLDSAQLSVGRQKRTKLFPSRWVINRNSLTEQCGHETFQISGFWAAYGQTGGTSRLVLTGHSIKRALHKERDSRWPRNSFGQEFSLWIQTDPLPNPFRSANFCSPRRLNAARSVLEGPGCFLAPALASRRDSMRVRPRFAPALPYPGRLS